MCQDLPLGCLHCLLVCAVQNRNFGCSARFYIFTGTTNGSETFCTVFLYKFFIFPMFGRIFKYQKYGQCSDCYRLFCFWQILFLMKSFCNQDLQSFHEHEQSSSLAPTLTMLVSLTFTFLFEKFWVPLFIFVVFKLYESTQ